MEKAARIGFVLEFVREIRKSSKGIGSEKLWLMYKSYFGEQSGLGRDAFAFILWSHGLNVCKKRRRIRTTNSEHPYPVYPNLIRDLEVTHINQVWVSDITYIRISSGFCYLSLVTDAYSREIIGYSVAPSLDTEYTVQALDMALGRLDQESAPDLIHHSDRGCQYASLLYTNLLKSKSIQISMTEHGDPRENAIAERVNGILKQEFLNDQVFSDMEQVKTAVTEAIAFYNNQRPHKSLDMMTPSLAASKRGRLLRRWASKYKKKYQTLVGTGAPAPCRWALPER